MPVPSKIELLDERFRTRIADMVKDHVSYEEIADMMNSELEAAGLDIRISRSSVGRYGKTLKDATRRLSETQAFARQLALDLGEKEGDQTFGLITEMLSHLMFKLMRSHTVEEAKEAFRNGAVDVKHLYHTISRRDTVDGSRERVLSASLYTGGKPGF